MKKIILSLTLFLFVFSLTGCGCRKKEEEKVVEKTTSDTPSEVFQFSGSELSLENGKTKISVDVINNSSKNEKLTQVKVTLNDSKGNYMADIIISVDEEIKSKETKTITGYCEEDITSAGSLQYEVIR